MQLHEGGRWIHSGKSPSVDLADITGNAEPT